MRGGGEDDGRAGDVKQEPNRFRGCRPGPGVAKNEGMLRTGAPSCGSNRNGYSMSPLICPLASSGLRGETPVRQTSRSRSVTPAFTLIELLVVIAIIAILIG